MYIRAINNEDEYIELEKLRYDVLGYNDESMINNNFYINSIKNKKMLPFALFYNNKMAAGVYISKSRNSLFVEYIFVDKKYQETGLKLGKNLLSFVLSNKSIVEKYFDQELTTSYIEPSNDKCVKMCEELGYKNKDDVLDCMSKIL